MWAPRADETREEFKAARATPFEGLLKDKDKVSIAIL